MALAFLFEVEAETEALIRECNKIGCCKNNHYVLAKNPVQTSKKSQLDISNWKIGKIKYRKIGGQDWLT